MLQNLMRWVRVRGLKEGPMQTARTEGFRGDAREDAVRPQDYGFAAMPVEGEGLRLEVAGVTIVLRLDRQAERPQLGAYEVCVWHREGHKVTLKSGGLVQADCTELRVNGHLMVNGKVDATDTIKAPTINGTTDVIFAGKSGVTHVHRLVQAGTDNSGTPV